MGFDTWISFSEFWRIKQGLVLEFIPHARQPATVYSLIQKPRNHQTIPKLVKNNPITILTPLKPVKYNRIRTFNHE